MGRAIFELLCLHLRGRMLGRDGQLLVHRPHPYLPLCISGDTRWWGHPMYFVFTPGQCRVPSQQWKQPLYCLPVCSFWAACKH